MTNEGYMISIGCKEKIIDDIFLQNAIDLYHAYFGKDKVEVILVYAQQLRSSNPQSYKGSHPPESPSPSPSK